MTEVELVGNALCLDFANTVNARPVARHDWLGTPEEAVTWAAAAGHPIGDPDGLTAALPDARRLRETVFRVFEALAQGGRAPGPDLGAVLALHGDGIAHGGLAEADGGFRLTWGTPRTVRVLLWEVAASAPSCGACERSSPSPPSSP